MSNQLWGRKMGNPTTRRYASTDWPQVAGLLADWPFKPFSGHALWPPSRLIALCLARAESALQNPQSTAWTTQSAGRVDCLVSLHPLPWDTDQIGLSAARLDYLVAVGEYDRQLHAKLALLDAVLQHCSERRIQYLIIRVDASDLSGLHALEQSGFITMDGLLTFALEPGQVPTAKEPESIRTRLATPADGEAAATLARQSFIYDRFHTDPAISQARADELHAIWVRNACLGQAADAVVLAEDEQGLLGFVTCKLQRDTELHLGKLVGTIVLVATAPRARRVGVAWAATLAALDWFRRQGASIVDVGTQFRNIPASRLYERCGFRLVGSSITLRRLL